MSIAPLILVRWRIAGAAVGWVTVQRGQLKVPEANISLVLKTGVLTGSLLLPDLTFSARRTVTSATGA